MDPLSLNYKSPPKRVILGNLNNQNGNSPISPMANLKLLTKVATSHFLVDESSDIVVSKQCEEDEDEIHTKCNRRLRSLSFICKKFLLLYELDIPTGEFKCISLGNLAVSLGIEKRRVYDIINVVASLQMAVKVCKDKYNWYGYQKLPAALNKLKYYAIQNKLHEHVKRMFQYQCLINNSNDDHNYDYEGIPKFKIKDEMYEDNRIGILCQKFMMLFLVAIEGGALNLAAVAKLILFKDTRDKTGMRRLYDVANVLESLGLIKRYGKINKRPSFIYCGPKVVLNEKEEASSIIDLPTPNLDFYETSSESSSDVPGFKKLDSMLEVVCTELERFDEEEPIAAKRRFQLNSPQVKKELFPAKMEESCTFIKAPTQSFRYSLNTITEQPQSSKRRRSCPMMTSGRTSTQTLESLSYPEIPTTNRVRPITTNYSNFKQLNSETMVLTKLGSTVKTIRPASSVPSIQNGAIYRAVKNGNVIQLVKL